MSSIKFPKKRWWEDWSKDCGKFIPMTRNYWSEEWKCLKRCTGRLRTHPCGPEPQPPDADGSAMHRIWGWRDARGTARFSASYGERRRRRDVAKDCERKKRGVNFCERANRRESSNP